MTESSIDQFTLLSDLVRKWEMDLARLVHLAAEGLLEVRVLAPEFYEEKIGESEYAEFPIWCSYSYEPIDPLIFRELVGRGCECVESGATIQGTPAVVRTLRRTTFGELRVTKKEINRFENTHLSKTKVMPNARLSSGVEPKSPEKGTEPLKVRGSASAAVTYNVIKAAIDFITGYPEAKKRDLIWGKRWNASIIARKLTENEGYLTRRKVSEVTETKTIINILTAHRAELPRIPSHF